MPRTEADKSKLKALKSGYQDWAETDVGKDLIQKLKMLAASYFKQSYVNVVEKDQAGNRIVRTPKPHEQTLYINRAAGINEVSEYIFRMVSDDPANSEGGSSTSASHKVDRNKKQG